MKVGQFTENDVMITSGLQAGEMVAIAGVHSLIKGQKVAPKLADNKTEVHHEWQARVSNKITQ